VGHADCPCRQLRVLSVAAARPCIGQSRLQTSFD